MVSVSKTTKCLDIKVSAYPLPLAMAMDERYHVVVFVTEPTSDNNKELAMRTKFLVVVELPSANNDKEAENSAARLFEKYSGREGNPLFCSHYRVSTKGLMSKKVAKTGQGYRRYFAGDTAIEKGYARFNEIDAEDIKTRKSKMFEKVAGRDVDDACQQSDDVGVYLVFHCDRNGYPTVFDACHAQDYSSKMEKSEVAFTIAQIVLDLGVQKIRKVGLIACNTHKQQQRESHSTFLEMFCGAAKGLFDKPPMIAGWDEYLEIAPSGSKMISNPAILVTPELRREHKFVARFANGKYLIDGVEKSGWSDKQQLPTNLGASKTIMH